MESQRTGWFMPARADLEALASTYSNSAIARACGVSETTVRKWLKKLGLPNRGKAASKADEDLNGRGGRAGSPHREEGLPIRSAEAAAG